MSLFQFGFQCASSSSSNSAAQDQQQKDSPPGHMPTFEESGLGMVEYESTLTIVTDLADPAPTTKRRLQGMYTHYLAKDRVCIGKYALENGNERKRHHLSAKYPELKESSIRNFKNAYKERLDQQ